MHLVIKRLNVSFQQLMVFKLALKFRILLRKFSTHAQDLVHLLFILLYDGCEILYRGFSDQVVWRRRLWGLNGNVLEVGLGRVTGDGYLALLMGLFLNGVGLLRVVMLNYRGLIKFFLQEKLLERLTIVGPCKHSLIELSQFFFVIVLILHDLQPVEIMLMIQLNLILLNDPSQLFNPLIESFLLLLILSHQLSNMLIDLQGPNSCLWSDFRQHHRLHCHSWLLKFGKQWGDFVVFGEDGLEQLLTLLLKLQDELLHEGDSDLVLERFLVQQLIRWSVGQFLLKQLVLVYAGLKQVVGLGQFIKLKSRLLQFLLKPFKCVILFSDYFTQIPLLEFRLELMLLDLPLQPAHQGFILLQLLVIFVLIKELKLFFIKLKHVILVDVKVRIHSYEHFVETLDQKGSLMLWLLSCLGLGQEFLLQVRKGGLKRLALEGRLFKLLGQFLGLCLGLHVLLQLKQGLLVFHQPRKRLC